MHTLLDLRYGVSGFPSLAHGGIVVTIIDEVMEILISINKKRLVQGIEDAQTARLHVSYLKSVVMPGVVLVSARFRETKGRNYIIDGIVKDKLGTVLSTAEALWDAPKQRNAKL